MNVALYVRVSTEEQAEDGFSIEAQIQELTAFCKRNGDTVVTKYKDEGHSGKSLNRPQLQKLLSDCQSGLFSRVLVRDVSRLSRKLYHILTVMDVFDKHNISFFSMNENTDYASPQGKAMLQVFGSFAEFQRNQIVANVKMGMTQRATEGKWNGGRVLGYESQNKQLVVNEREAEIVRYIFDLYVDGHGYKAIANRLNHAGYKTKRNAEFSVTSVRNIVSNATYAGFIVFNKVQNWEEKRRKGTNGNPIFEKGEHEAIIDLDTWEKAKAIQQQKSGKSPKLFQGHFPLSGLLKCPTCGQGMIAHKMKTSESSSDYKRYYQCGNFHRKGSAVCLSNLVYADVAEQMVFTKLEEIMADYDLLDNLINKVNTKVAEQKKPIMEQLAYNEKQMEQVTGNIKRYQSLFETGEVPGKLLIERMASYEKELDALKARIFELEQELSQVSIQEVPAHKIKMALQFFADVLPKATPEKQKSLLHTLINRITVHPSGDIRKRTVQDIELFFDTTVKGGVGYVPTCGTVHRARCECRGTTAQAERLSPADEGA